MAGPDEERREGGSPRCRRGYWWAGSAAAGEPRLKRRPPVSQRQKSKGERRRGASGGYLPPGGFRYWPTSPGSSLMDADWPWSCRNTSSGQAAPTTTDNGGVRRCTLTPRRRGEAFPGGAGLNAKHASWRDRGSGLGPPSGSSCFTKMADRCWWKFHSNSLEREMETKEREALVQKQTMFVLLRPVHPPNG